MPLGDERSGSTAGPLLVQLTGEIAAILGGAYESFLKARLERLAGRRGKVHVRAFVVFADIVSEMLVDAGIDAGVVWRAAAVEPDLDRGEIEAGVVAEGGAIEVDHEWAAFVAWVEQVCASQAR